MVQYSKWIEKTILITVRTYPVPSKSSIEVSCTAGIDENAHWIRIYPIPYRFLDPDKRFSKYQYIKANVAKAESDPRLESYKINIESISIQNQTIPTDNKWELRKAKLFPLLSPSLCYLQKTRDLTKEPTLGLFKPKVITALKIEAARPYWTEGELSRLRQYPLFGNLPKTQLEKLPHDFSYNFKCDDPNCKGHELKCTDWEMGAAYWAWKRKYSSGWETKFRERFETEMALVKDTHFFVGTLSNHPSEWIVIGLFYPPR